MIRVYIASPYSTSGDIAENVHLQMETANTLIGLGFCPFVPLLTHFQHLMFPRPYEDWMKQDTEWVKVCDCLLRLGGESKGADREVKYALSLGKPVVYSVEDLVEYYREKK